MPDLLLELFSEEIPARMQARAAEDLRRLVTGALRERGLSHEGAASFATPRRLALHMAGLPTRQPDTRDEKRGPRVGAPDAAVQGFLKSVGLTSLAEAKIRQGFQKRRILYRRHRAKGQGDDRNSGRGLARRDKRLSMAEIHALGQGLGADRLAALGPPAARDPRHIGPETEATEVVPFAVDGVSAGNFTFGHRFMAPGKIKVRRFDDYVAALEKAKVVLDPAGGATSSFLTRATLPWRKGSNSSRTTRSCTKSRGWSNGRWR